MEPQCKKCGRSFSKHHDIKHSFEMSKPVAEVTGAGVREEFIKEFKDMDYDWHGITYFKGSVTNKIADWWLARLEAVHSRIVEEVEKRKGQEPFWAWDASKEQDVEIINQAFKDL